MSDMRKVGEARNRHRLVLKQVRQQAVTGGKGQWLVLSRGWMNVDG